MAKSVRAGDLGTVPHISRRDFDERETFLFRAQVPCLEYASLLIEIALMLRTSRNGRIYVGFEKLSRMQPIAERFLRIADISERVYIFGEDDWRPPRHPNMKLVLLKSNTRLAREWFVIADTSTVHTALVARDEDGFDVPVLEERYFSAFKSSDPAIVSQLAAFAESFIDSTLNL